MKTVIKYAFVLGLICSLSAGILAAVNNVTAPVIAAQGQSVENNALKQLLPKASSFQAREKDGAVQYFAAYDPNGKLAGLAFTVSAKGYSSDIQAIAAVTTELKISDVMVLYQNETPGLGTKVTQRSFLDAFKGKSQAQAIREIQTITGATISSSAVKDAIAKKFEELEPLLKQEITGSKQ